MTRPISTGAPSARSVAASPPRLTSAGEKKIGWPLSGFFR
jgi:hypothetical protein